MSKQRQLIRQYLVIQTMALELSDYADQLSKSVGSLDTLSVEKQGCVTEKWMDTLAAMLVDSPCKDNALWIQSVLVNADWSNEHSFVYDKDRVLIPVSKRAMVELSLTQGQEVYSATVKLIAEFHKREVEAGLIRSGS